MAPLARAREALCVAATALVILFVFVSFLIHRGRKRHGWAAVLPKTPLRVAAIGVVSLSFVAEFVVVVALRSGRLARLQEHLVSAAFFALAWAVITLRRALLVSEIFGLALITSVFAVPLLVLDAVARPPVNQTALLVVESVRLLVVLVLLAHAGRHLLPSKDSLAEAEEARPLLDGSNGSSGDHGAGPASVSYGTEANPRRRSTDSASDSSSFSGSFSGSDSCCSSSGSSVWSSDDESGDPKKSRSARLRKSGSWMAYLAKFKIFVPFLIPKKDYKVQLCLLTCVVCIIIDRGLNILVPRQIGIVADKLVSKQAPYAELAVYLGLSLLHGESGVPLIQALAKIPVQQFSYRQLTNAAFNHVMGLDMDFHSDRDSAEVMKAVEQGEALTNLLETAVLDVAPTICDMGVAFVFLYLKFNSTVALCMVVASTAFLTLEVVSSGWNMENRRRSTKAAREEARVMHQAVQGWRTVSAFNMFSYERVRFGGAVDRNLVAKKSWARRDAFIQALLFVLAPVTFFLLALLVIREVQLGHSTPGDFVFLIQYWEYLLYPIRSLSEKYRWLVADLIDAERLLDLLMTETKVADKAGAPALGRVEGRVEFDNVEFSYDSKRTTLRDINITASPGETVALVGTTGAGKSSLMKLLLRYYDVTSGSIKIDGHDIRDVTQGSLRDVIGVVPQDPLLFNASVMDNLRYARLSASDEDIFDACRAAAIHDDILGFSDGYDTKVGEQGVRLSGGEIQRLAIARVFLKDPPILVLDEATSAVDTKTESEIQAALKRLSRKRTTFVIAHRLSTIVDASQILVLHEGTIVERGSHQALLAKGGKYHSLWQMQLGGTHDGAHGSKHADGDDDEESDED